MIYLQFVVSASIIVIAGIKLTHYADILSGRLKLGKVWIGIVLLGFVTSLPEAVTSLVAVVSLGANDLAVGNIVGSINFNILLIVVMDLLFRAGSITNKIRYDKENILPVLFAALLTSVVIMEIFFCSNRSLGTIFGMSFGSLIIFIIYFSGMKMIKNAMSSREEMLASIDAEKKSGHSLGYIWLVLFLSAFFVVLAATLLASSADALAEATGLGRTFVGTIFLAFVTSLPELVVTISALHLGAFGMAMGNIFGSNMTNIFILFLCDVFYRSGSLFQTVSKMHLIAAALNIALTGIVLLGVRQRNKKTILGLGWDSYTIMCLFVLGMGMLYYYK